MKLRLDGWTNCYFEVEDESTDYFYGVIREMNGRMVCGTLEAVTPRMVVQMAKDQDWEELVMAEDVLNGLSVKGER